MIHVDPQVVSVMLKRDDIIQLFQDLANASGFTLEELVGPGRTFKLSRIRQYGMLLAHMAGHSTPDIADVLNRDHTTVIHGIKSAQRRIKKMKGQLIDWVAAIPFKSRRTA